MTRVPRLLGGCEVKSLWNYLMTCFRFTTHPMWTVNRTRVLNVIPESRSGT